MKTTSYALTILLLCLTIIPLGAAITIYPTINASYITYYKFNQNLTGENSTNIYDITGNGYNATLQITTNGMNFTDFGYDNTKGITSYGNNTNNTRVSNLLNITNYNQGITFAAWINTSSFTNGAGILSWRSTSMGLSQTAGAYRCAVSNTTADTGQTATSSAVTTGVYHYVMCTYDGQYIKIYVDGIKQATSTIQTGAINYSAYTGTQGLWIGRQKGGTETVMNATIDEVIVINSSTNEAEAWNIYQNYVGGCINATEGLILQGGNSINAPVITKICENSYNLSGHPTNGAIRFGSDNAVLNITNVNLTGNYSCSNCIGILTNTKSNITIIGNRDTTKINGFGYGIQIDASGTAPGTQNIIVDGINYQNLNNNSIHYRFFTGGILSNVIINKSTFNFTGGQNYIKNTFSTYVQNTNITYQYDDFISTTATTTFAMSINGTRNLTIIDSTFIGPNTLSSVGFNLPPTASNISGITLIRNNFSGYNNQILLSTPDTGDIRIEGVIGINTDTCLNIGHTTSPSIINLTCVNATSDLDNFNLAVRLYNVSNVTFTWLNVTDYGSWALWGQKTYNINISNFYVNGIADINRSNYRANDLNDPNGAFRFTTLFKSWITNQNELRYNGTEIGLEPLESYNVTIGNGTYGYNVQVLLWTQGGGNITAVLPSNWNRSFDAPSYLTDTNVLYVNNLFNNLTRYSGGITSILQFGYKAKYFFNYTIDRDYSLFKNINTTASENQTFFNLTGSIVYISNGSVVCNPSNTCHNITYLTSQYNTSYSLINYNIIQGNNRIYDPVSINQIPASTTITNTLLDTIYNVTTVVLSSTLPVSPVLQHSNYSENVSGVYDPGAGTFTFTATLTPGDNILYLNGATIDGVYTTGCDASGEYSDAVSGAAGFLVILFLIGIAAIAYKMYSGDFSGIDLQTLAIGTTVIVVVGLLWLVIGGGIIAGIAGTC